MNRKSFNLLKLPLDEDPNLNRLMAIQEALKSEEEPLYVAVILTVLLDHLADIAEDEDNENANCLLRAEQHLEEASLWFDKYYKWD